MTIAGRALRLIVGILLAWSVIGAIASPPFPFLCKAAALLIAAATMWQPVWGLALVTMLAPAGALMAPAPARAAELLAWSMLAAWLLAVWRPLSRGAAPRGVMTPLTLYAAALIASWLSLTVGGAAGVLPQALPRFLVDAVGATHLLVSSPEAETWTLLQALSGLGVGFVAVLTARDDARTPRILGVAIVASMAALAAATLFQAGPLRGERYSLPLTDINAAGSLYALAAAIALGYAWLRPSGRIGWGLTFALLAVAIWLSGSRSAYFAVAAAAAVYAAVRARWQPTRRHLVVGAAIFFAATLVAALLVRPQSEVEGSAAQSANLRSQFLLTSARMFASAPVFGVGVGQYFDRSAEFMTPELRDLYGNENAHNYFAQQFAELGLAGGLVFVWLIGAVLSHGWRAVLRRPDDTALQTLFAGAAAYGLTCATGHPLLVPEAALPFWAACGAVAAAPAGASLRKPRRAPAIAAGVMLAACLGRAALVYARPTVQPPEEGFHQMETMPDGAPFRWMTRHAVTYIPDGPGWLHLRVRAPGWPAPEPVVLQTSIAGQLVDTREVPADTTTTWDIPARAGRGGFRRVDFRVNQEWFEEIRLGRRTARRPVSLMVETISWTPLR